MIGLLVVTHQTLGVAYRALATHFFGGLPEHVRIREVSRDEPLEMVRHDIEQLLAQFPPQLPILLLTDVFGATPCNIARQFLQKERMLMLTGINVAMMVKALQNSAHAKDLHAFAQDVRQTACEGIMLIEADEETCL